MTILKVGIASYASMKARTLDIARGKAKPAADEPKIWFTSTESMARVLSAKNRELLETIRALRRGDSRLTPQIARKVMDQFRQLAAASRDSRFPVSVGADSKVLPAVAYPNAEPLTEKEERLLEFITEGMTNRQIAAAMSLAEGTVKNYISRIMEKLHANTRTELAMLSRRQPRAD